MIHAHDLYMILEVGVWCPDTTLPITLFRNFYSDSPLKILSYLGELILKT